MLNKSCSNLQCDGKSTVGTFHPENIIGNSDAMQSVFENIETAAKSDITVLIIGEYGVGKERVANAIHHYSKRTEESFVTVHCADFSESHIEGALFGYERGAFNGMKTSRKGSLEIAHGGTIYLDEIGELPPVVQAKFLTFIKKREFERIGGNKTIKVNVRIIAATSRNLDKLIKEGKFNEDLFYHLNVFPIIVPPLRERGEDILALSQHFINKYARELGKNVTGLASDAIGMVMSHYWPGNVRELGNCIERAIILSSDELIKSSYLPSVLQERSGHSAN